MQIIQLPRPTLILLVAGLTTLGALSARVNHMSAAPVPRAATTAPDTVRGIVFDSLTNAPLVDAFVTAEGENATTTSDSLGRFTLVGEKRITRLTAFHEALDQTGFGALVVQRPADAERWNDALLTTPSIGTIWTSACKMELPAGDNRAVLVGSATMPDNRTRVSGASIRLQYQVILPRTGLSQVEELEAVTDSLGSFVVCGAPVYGEVAVMGLSSQVRSGAVRIAFENRPLQRLDLVLGPVDGPVSRWPTITGTVVDDKGAPLAGATVEVDGRDSAATTGPDGAFSLREVPLGSRMLTVQADGFRALASPVNVLYENTPTISISMEKVFTIAGLEGIQVTERTQIRRTRREFEERREAGIAHIVDSTDINLAGSLQAALSQIPGLLVATAIGQTDSSRFDIRARGRNLGVQTCQATLFVDGILVKITDVWAVRPSDIAAIEVYRSEAFAPAMFAEFAESDCALVAFWTRFGLRP